MNDHGKLLMTILVTGATGTIGTQVVAQLRARNVQFRALVRDPGKAKLPTGVDVVRAEFLDVDAMRAALKGVSTVFLLNAVVPDELTQALIALNLAREAGVERIVYRLRDVGPVAGVARGVAIQSHIERPCPLPGGTRLQLQAYWVKATLFGEVPVGPVPHRFGVLARH